MIHKASNLIADCFDIHDVKYRIEEYDEASVVEASFPVDAGPQVVARFFSTDDDNDVAIRLFGLVCKVPESRRAAVLAACNRLNAEIRYYKFYLNEDNSLNVETDLPVRVDDSSVGECCFELFVRLMKILDDRYGVIASALYAEPAEEKNEPLDLFRLLSELKGKPIELEEGEEDRAE